MFRDISFYIVDILIAIDKIKRYTKSITNSDELLHNELIWDATIRELIIIGEAVNILLKNNFISDEYRKIVDFRNIIVHGYFGIDKEIVWEVVNSKIHNLYNELIKLIKNLKLNLTDTINEAKKDFYFNKEIINFLNNLKTELK